MAGRGGRRLLDDWALDEEFWLDVKTCDNCILMGDLKDARLIYLKGFLFLIIGVLGVCGLLAENFSLRNAFLLALSVWAFCRFYYFLFYVIEKYVDGNYKFAGFSSVLIYLWNKRRRAG